ncbi:MAG: GGDEF domain-containing protein [Planctomycetota bacterium]|jgi:diguanylate cyclase (GGDEF)-like protein
MLRSLRESPFVAPTLVVLLGLAAAYFAWSTTSRVEREEAVRVLDERRERFAQRLEDFAHGQADLARALRSLSVHAPHTRGDELARLREDMVLPSPRFTSVRHIGWVERFVVGPGGLDPADLPAGLHDLDGEPVSAPGRHDVVLHVAPRRSGGLLPGLDLASDPLRRDALDRCLRSGDLSVSRALQPVDPLASDGDRALMLAIPAFEEGVSPRTPEQRREALAGFVVVLYDVDDFMRSALHGDATSGGISDHEVIITEGGEELGRLGSTRVPDQEPSVGAVSVFDSSWVVNVRPSEGDRPTFTELMGRPSTLLPLSILVAMVLAASIVWTLKRQNEIIRRQVGRQTAALRQQNLVLERKEHELNELNRRLLAMSNTDALTGILNRRAFEEQLENERERSKRTAEPFGLLLFDVDHFKGYNDQYGHVAGDEVLRQVANIINNEARRIDCVARYGGEEFVVLASRTDANGLLALGDRIRVRIQEASIENAASPVGVITVSGGGSLSRPDDGFDGRDVIEIADRCLYQAKDGGRNRVVMVM